MTQPEAIPTEEDWINPNPSHDLDEQSAKDEFFGKSIAQVLAGAGFTRGNPICLVWDLRAISKIPFQYYIFAMRDFTLTAPVTRPEEASTAASCFINLIRNKLTETPDFILPIYSDLQPALEYIASNQSLFDADLDIYGDFKGIYAEIAALEQAARNA
jgi:hypothetical protein